MAIHTPEPPIEQSVTDTKQRVLDVAEALFMQRGYSAITLRDVATALEIKQASLYYHFPNGKEEIFIAVVERVFARHLTALDSAVERARPLLSDQLNEIMISFLEQPPMNLTSLMHADMPVLTKAGREHLTKCAYESIFAPLRGIFAAAQARDDIRSVDLDTITGAFLSIIDGLRFRQTQKNALPMEAMAKQLVEVLIDGLKHRTDRDLP